MNARAFAQQGILSQPLVCLMPRRNRIKRATHIYPFNFLGSLWQKNQHFLSTVVPTRIENVLHGIASIFLRLSAGSRPIETVRVNREEFTAITT
jgi:hypothetical protein